MIIVNLLRKLLGEPVVQVGAINAFSGIGFAGANLVLAWVLSSEHYGLIALVIALTNIGIGIGPLGLTGVVIRKLVRTDRRLLCSGLVAALITASGICLFGYAVYRLDTFILVAMLAAIIAGAMTLLAAAKFQYMQRFVVANSLNQFGNLGLAIASIIVLILGTRTPLLPLFLIAVTFLAAASWSWSYLLRHPDSSEPKIRHSDYSDALSMAGLIAAVQVLLQLERILIPEFMSLESLAVFGVMAAIVIAPYRSLELAVSFTLLPRLRSTSEPERKRHLLKRESVFVILLCLTGGTVIFVVTPLLISWLYVDRYPVTQALIVAGIASGFVRVISAVARTAAIAYCSTKEMWLLTWYSWVAVVTGLIGAFYGSKWGLPGIVYGVGVGFVFRAIASCWIAIPYYREQVLPDSTTPSD